jgi:hypothetical protein
VPRALIEGYCSASSVVQGGTLSLHVRAVAPHAYYSVEVYRTGLTDILVGTSFGKSFIPPADQDDVMLAQKGCGWPVGCTLKIDPSWPTGLYYIRLTSFQDAAGTKPLGAMNNLGFVVRSAQPGAQSAILLCIADTTYQAYNAWGGRSLYSTPQAITVSFDRPYDNQNAIPVGAGELPFIAWAESKGIALEYCTSADLHAQNILSNYSLLLSVGHDEYWSKQMRDYVESFAAVGGNVCFFSGNNVWWQIRFQSNLRTMVCYKYVAPDPIQDPALGGPTTEWYTTGRPPNTLVGAGFLNGAGWWGNVPQSGPRLRGYTVQNADHWVYAGTGLTNGAVFGQGSTVNNAIIGYETDAAVYAFDSNGVAQPTGADGSPSDFTILGYADLTDWPNDGNYGQPGYATMGLTERAGVVFTAGTVNWAAGLLVAGGPVEKITLNLLTELGGATVSGS